MIERLISSLRALAAPVDLQLARYPEFVVKADELALDFADALLLVSDCPQVQLTPEQREALAKIDTLLEQMSGPANAELWTETALRARPEWKRVRKIAGEALSVLGYDWESPPPHHSIYIPVRPV